MKIRIRKRELKDRISRLEKTVARLDAAIQRLEREKK